MKNKNILFFLTGLVLIGMVANSCKKDDQTPIQTLFTTGSWQLASVIVYHYLGGSQVGLPDTLNTNCGFTQMFTFPTNNTCTYTNYHCVQQSANGTWSLTHDQLFLEVKITCTDTVPGNPSATMPAHPFIYTKILSLGQYSMVLQTGDIGAYYTTTTKRTIYQYGFVRQKAASN